MAILTYYLASILNSHLNFFNKVREIYIAFNLYDSNHNNQLY